MLRSSYLYYSKNASGLSSYDETIDAIPHSFTSAPFRLEVPIILDGLLYFVLLYSFLHYRCILVCRSSILNIYIFFSFCTHGIKLQNIDVLRKWS